MYESAWLLLGWNAVIAAILAAIVAALSWTPYLRRRPALCHSLWLLVLIKLVTPPVIPLPVLAADESDREHASETARSEIPSSPETAVVTEIHGTGAHVNCNEMRHVAPEGGVVVQQPPRDAQILASSSEQPIASELAESAKASVFSFDFTMQSIAIGVWLAVSFTLLIFGWLQVRRMARLLHRAGKADDRLQRIARGAAERMRVRDVDVRFIDGQAPPMIWIGWSGPVIVFPKKLAAKLSDEQINCIACHELAHFARRDQWFNTFALVVTALCWWHPAAWWARRRMRKAQELCCDEQVIHQCEVSRKSYLETLFQALEFIQTKHVMPNLASSFGDGRSIKSRFAALARGQLVHRNSRLSHAALIVLFAGLLCVPVHGQDNDEAADENKPKPQAKAKINEKPLYLHYLAPDYFGQDAGTSKPRLIKSLRVVPENDFDVFFNDPDNEARRILIQGRIALREGKYVCDINASYFSLEVYSGELPLEQLREPSMVTIFSGGIAPMKLVLSHERSAEPFLKRMAGIDGSALAPERSKKPSGTPQIETPGQTRSGDTKKQAKVEKPIYLHWFKPFYRGDNSAAKPILTLRVSESEVFDITFADKALKVRKYRIKGVIKAQNGKFVGDVEAVWKSGERFTGEFKLEDVRKGKVTVFSGAYFPTRVVMSYNRLASKHQIRELIGQLASKNAPPPPDETKNFRVRPDDWDENAQNVVYFAKGKLLKLGKTAFPILLENLDDKRYCMTRSYSIEINHSVGEVCGHIIVESVELADGPYKSRTGADGKDYVCPSYFAANYGRDLKKWWKDHRDKTLLEMQIEALRWRIAEEKRIGALPADRKWVDEFMKKLTYELSVLEATHAEMNRSNEARVKGKG
jgi:beta-lactamase regulating signal transducer with metallopeptidase domain